MDGTMRSLKFVGLAAAVLAVGLFTVQAPVGHAEGPKGPSYVGSKACKTCHMGAAKGAIYEAWEKTDHAQALAKLPGDKQKDPTCLPCHTTGFGKPGGYDPAAATAANLAGVGCESCHGPGSDYKAMNVMKDKAASVAKGLIEPNEKSCQGCHNSTMPKDCWKGGAEAPKFAFAEAVKKIEHHVPKKDAAK